MIYSINYYAAVFTDDVELCTLLLILDVHSFHLDIPSKSCAKFLILELIFILYRSCPYTPFSSLRLGLDHLSVLVCLCLYICIILFFVISTSKLLGDV